MRDFPPGGMVLGLALPNYGPELEPSNLLDAARAAEESGFDSIWTTDHIAVPTEQAAVYGRITEAIVTLAFVAAATSRIQLGISALVVPPREPLLALKQVMSLDFLSRGRLKLCVAAGWTEAEFRNLGSTLRGRGRRLDTWLQLLDRAWANAPGRIDFDGPGLHIEDAHLAPEPVAKTLELWGAGHSPTALARAAKLGTWHPVSRTVEEIRALSADLRALNPQSRVILRIAVRLQAGPDRSGLDPRGRPGIAGPAEWIAERLQEYSGAGCDGFVLMIGGGSPGLPERIRELAAQLGPLLRPHKEEVSG